MSSTLPPRQGSGTALKIQVPILTAIWSVLGISWKDAGIPRSNTWYMLPVALFTALTPPCRFRFATMWTIPSVSMPPQKKPMNSWPIPMPLCIKYPPPDSGFSRFTAPGADRTWPFSFSPGRSWKTGR